MTRYKKHWNWFVKIVKMKKMVQSFLADQKTENFKFVKEIALLQKDKIEIQNQLSEIRHTDGIKVFEYKPFIT